MDTRSLAQDVIDAIWEQADDDGGVIHRDRALDAVERKLKARVAGLANKTSPAYWPSPIQHASITAQRHGDTNASQS